MGGRGQAPTPTSLRMLKGNPQHRPMNDQEPKIALGEVQPTEDLDEIALRTWRRTVPILLSAGLATPADAEPLTAMCQKWSEWAQIQGRLITEGFVVMRKGIPVRNPLAQQADVITGQLKGYFCEFGMTPASRSRIKVDAPKPKSKIESFREKHGG